MKIVLISFLYEPELGGGAAQVVYSLAHELALQGHNISVITSAPVSQPVIEIKDNIKIIRIYPQNLYWVNEKDRQPIYRKILWQMIDAWNPFVYWQVRDILSAEKPDLVHVHKLRGLSPSVWSAAWAAGVPMLLHTCHDYELISPEGQLSTRVGRLAEKRVFWMRPYQQFRAKFSTPVLRVSGPSHYILKVHKSMGYFKRALWQMIPNSHGIRTDDLAQIRLKKKNQYSTPYRLLYLGRLVPEKGVEILCQSVAECGQEGLDVELDVVGWGYLESKLRAQFVNNPNIHFHGAMFGKGKQNLISQCDVLVLPSTYPESFGIVIAEAYAYGKPVIASRIGAIPEIVKEGETGYLFSPGNKMELASLIKDAASNPARLESMQNACFEAAAQYASDVVMQQYLDFYHG